MSEHVTSAVVDAARQHPISQREFRDRTGLPRASVCEAFCEAWMLGLIRETGERYYDRKRRITGPGSPRYEATI